MKKLLSLAALTLLLALPVRAAAPEQLDGSARTLGDGVEYSKEIWRFDDGVEREIETITVDMDSATLLLATPGDDDDNDGGSGKGAALADMANDALAHGKDVLAVVNGDFYKTSSDGASQYASYAALGVLVKDGVLLSEGQRALGAMYLGVSNKGEALMGSAEDDGDWDKVNGSLLTAVGGELWLVRHGESNLSELRWRTSTPTLSARYGSAGQVYDADGVPYTTAAGALSSYPRTAAGILPDGRVLLLTASAGGVTPGLTVPQLTELLLSKGCTEAMNLDGGPSSQMLCVSNGKFYPGENKNVSARVGVGIMVAVGKGEAALAHVHDTVAETPAGSFNARLYLSVAMGVAIYFLFTRMLAPNRKRR